jgi:hypothetical protein
VPMCSSAFPDAVRSGEHSRPGSTRDCPVRRAAHPLRSLPGEALWHIEGGVALAPVVDGTGQLMGEDGHRLALTRFFLSAGEIFLARRMVAKA